MGSTNDSIVILLQCNNHEPSKLRKGKRKRVIYVFDLLAYTYRPNSSVEALEP